MLQSFYLYFIIAMFALVSCAGSKSLSFTSDHIQPGMTKAQVISKFGKPDRESFYKAEDVLYETLYYVRFERKGATSYYDYILEFKNGALVSMRNEPQIDKSAKNIILKKE